MALLGAAFGLASTALGSIGWPTLFTAGCLLAVGTTLPAATLFRYTTELYPTRIRAFATSIVTNGNRLATVISPIVIGTLLDHGGIAWIFTILAAMALMSLVVITLTGIETRNRSLEEISH